MLINKIAKITVPNYQARWASGLTEQLVDHTWKLPTMKIVKKNDIWGRCIVELVHNGETNGHFKVQQGIVAMSLNQDEKKAFIHTIALEDIENSKTILNCMVVEVIRHALQ